MSSLDLWHYIAVADKMEKYRNGYKLMDSCFHEAQMEFILVKHTSMPPYYGGYTGERVKKSLK